MNKMILSGFYYMGAYHKVMIVNSIEQLPTSAKPIGSTKGLDLYDTHDWQCKFYAIRK